MNRFILSTALALSALTGLATSPAHAQYRSTPSNCNSCKGGCCSSSYSTRAYSPYYSTTLPRTRSVYSTQWNTLGGYNRTYHHSHNPSYYRY